jgi:hypothetical protein
MKIMYEESKDNYQRELPEKSMDIMIKLISNILKNINEQKYRQFKTTNKKIEE